MKLSGVKYLFDQGVENVWKNKMMAFATFCVLLISLLLVGVSVLFYINIDSIIGGMGDKNEIVVFAEDGVATERLEQISEQMKKIDGVATVDFVSKEEGLNIMSGSINDIDGLLESLKHDNPLPDGYKVRAKEIDKIDSIVNEISSMDDIAQVKTSHQFVTFLREMRRTLSVVGIAIISALLMVSAIMISNTTKASIFARREEIQIMKYVGATNAFIRLPFFVEGLVVGFFAGIGSYLLTWFSYASVYKLMSAEISFTNIVGSKSLIPFSNIQIEVLLAYVIAGGILGAFGSGLFTKKHVNV